MIPLQAQRYWTILCITCSLFSIYPEINLTFLCFPVTFIMTTSVCSLVYIIYVHFICMKWVAVLCVVQIICFSYSNHNFLSLWTLILASIKIYWLELTIIIKSLRVLNSSLGSAVFWLNFSMEIILSIQKRKKKFLKIHYVWACNIQKRKTSFAKTQFECAFRLQIHFVYFIHSLFFLASFLYLNIIYIPYASRYIFFIYRHTHTHKLY